jgi:hypothetical protein
LAFRRFESVAVSIGGDHVSKACRAATIALALFALVGAVFAGFSASDYVAHLDRQVHAITCSVIPGVGAADTAGTSGCHTALMSPYSALLRSWTWGGIPIALPGLALFAFLLFRAASLLFNPEPPARVDTLANLLAGAAGVVASVVFFSISVLKLGTVCTLCAGMYVAYLGGFAATVVAHVATPSTKAPRATARAGLAIAEGLAFVALPVLLYVAAKPAYPTTLTRCGELRHAEDRYGVHVALGRRPGAVPAIEVLDPLCPACRSFSQRLALSGLAERLDLSLVLFPLDRDCNWMLNDSLHPGACTVSEAVLCAGDAAGSVLEWTFEHQDELRTLGSDQARLAARLAQQFPAVAPCLGRPAVKARLNRSLRWAVNNSLPVVTPQLFVRGAKVCEEDTDLGLEYVLTRLVAEPRVGGR